MSLRDRTISVLLGAYKWALSPVLHAMPGVAGACRFQPTCSEYAAIAISEYGAARGGWMALLRLLRCHPFHRGGFDPVPANPLQPNPLRPNPLRHGDAPHSRHPHSLAPRQLP